MNFADFLRREILSYIRKIVFFEFSYKSLTIREAVSFNTLEVDIRLSLDNEELWRVTYFFNSL